ncbi:hypothetical protein F5Y00DRAFT_261309 [Daldinia vernicosa]|uniref:uncharacterized protein n=1 Tax=Daldinia vernicosa TaxID=114800 RepID=UPI0020082542|nr:uncharacterized protein F5Y00DRAFT_261309 [Daldinia vernicosa]KAI0849525.1 hypothetical protein F5Y00DRAFT_261309 [Daldinia vernicosa]
MSLADYWLRQQNAQKAREAKAKKTAVTTQKAPVTQISSSESDEDPIQNPLPKPSKHTQPPASAQSGRSIPGRSTFTTTSITNTEAYQNLQTRLKALESLKKDHEDREIAMRFHIAARPDIPWIDIIPALQHNLNNSSGPYPFHLTRHSKVGFPPALFILLFNKGTYLNQLPNFGTPIPKLDNIHDDRTNAATHYSFLKHPSNQHWRFLAESYLCNKLSEDEALSKRFAKGNGVDPEKEMEDELVDYFNNLASTNDNTNVGQSDKPDDEPVSEYSTSKPACY